MFIFPVARHLPTRHTAWVTYSLIAANTLIFVFVSVPLSVNGVARRFGFTPAHPDLVTAFTAMFLHASIFHLLWNMLALWLFGESVEDALGHGQIFVCYLASGLFGMFLFYLANARSTIPCVGASGAILGLAGMYMVLFPRAKMDVYFYIWRFPIGNVTASASAAVALWLGEQTLLGGINQIIGWSLGWSLRIAFLAHVGGILAGVGLGLIFSRLGLSPAYREMMARKTARSMRCPGCQANMPRREAGRYRCSGCRTRFQVDEEGNVAVVSPSKPKSRVR
jgi:membrane associated rhomboid family serine protease